MYPGKNWFSPYQTVNIRNKGDHTFMNRIHSHRFKKSPRAVFVSHSVIGTIVYEHSTN